MPFLAPIGVAVAGSAVAGTAAATIIGGATLLAGGLGIAALAKGVFGKPPKAPSVPSLTQALGAQPTVGPTQAQAEKKSRTVALAEQRERLRGSKTILTSPQGLLSPIQVTGKTLLGA